MLPTFSTCNADCFRRNGYLRHINPIVLKYPIVIRGYVSGPSAEPKLWYSVTNQQSLRAIMDAPMLRVLSATGGLQAVSPLLPTVDSSHQQAGDRSLRRTTNTTIPVMQTVLSEPTPNTFSTVSSRMFIQRLRKQPATPSTFLSGFSGSQLI